MAAQGRPSPVGIEIAQGAGFYRFAVGTIAAMVVADGDAPFPVPSWPLWSQNAAREDLAAQLRAHFLPTDTVDMHFNALFVDTGTARVLIDAGVGPALGPRFGQVAAHLRRGGVDPATVSHVILSHGHSDHIHGLLDGRGDPTFPNARHVWVDDEWHYWNSARAERDLAALPLPEELRAGHVQAARHILPALAGRTDRVPAASEVAPGVTLLPAPGHTPAMTAVLIASGESRLLYLADVAHIPATSLPHPEWSPSLDHQPGEAMATRRRLLGQAADERMLVMAYHFPFPALGHVRRAGAAFAWEPVAWEW